METLNSTGLWAAAVIALCGGGMAAIGAARSLEPRLLFGRPRKLRPAPLGPHDSHLTVSVRIAGDDGCPLSGIVTRPVRDALGANGSVASSVLLWFGGRNEDVRWTSSLASWLGADHAVAAFAYRGSGGSGGRATEDAVVRDGVRIVDWLLREERFAGARLLLAGRSLGTAVATQVAAHVQGAVPLAGLVLLSPMDSIRSMVRAHPLLRPAARLMRSPFDSMAAAASLACPSLVLLAERDERVGHARSRRLAGVLPSPVVETIAGTDHKSLPRSAGALAAIAAFAAAL